MFWSRKSKLWSINDGGVAVLLSWKEWISGPVDAAEEPALSLRCIGVAVCRRRDDDVAAWLLLWVTSAERRLRGRPMGFCGE